MNDVFHGCSLSICTLAENVSKRGKSDNVQESPRNSHLDRFSEHSFYVIAFILCYCNYSRTSMARTSLGPWKLVRDMGNSSHFGLIMTRGQEANNDKLRKSFSIFNKVIVC